MKPFSPYGRSLLQLFSEIQVAVARVSYPMEDSLGDVGVVCAVDAAHSGEATLAAAITYDLKTQEMTAAAHAVEELSPPYIPGLLALSEANPMVEAIRHLPTRWDLLLVDGHGKAHPRMSGLATFLGFILGRPSVGFAKRLLVGEVDEIESTLAPINYKGEVVGFAVRHTGRTAFYVSQGYGVSLGDVQRIVELLGMEYPAALKHAHREARRLAAELLEKR